jgi:hypothetical protein
MSLGAKTRGQLINIDHAREERQRWLKQRGVPPAFLAIGLLGIALAATATFLYYGTRIVLWGLLIVAEMMR